MDGETKPRVVQTALRGWKSLGGAFTAFPLTLIATLVLGAGLAEAFFAVPYLRAAAKLPAYDEMKNAQLVAYLVRKALAAIVWPLVAAPLVTAIHRLVVLGDRRPGFPYARPETRKVLAWLMALNLSILAAQSFPLLMMKVAFVQGLSAFVMSILIAVTLVQVGLMFPAMATGVAAAGAEQRLDQGFAMAKGNFLRIFFSLLLAMLPLFLITYILAKVMNGPPPPPPPAPPPPPLKITPVRLGAAVLLGMVNIVMMGVIASVYSWLYRGLRGGLRP